jgi:pimeloyl-ACP methyl ester carboxylesterase
VTLPIHRHLARGAAVAVALVALGYATALAALYLRQDALIFRAVPLPADYRFPIEQDFEEMRIAVPGASLDALLIRQPDSRGLVFFLHGNAGNLATWTTGLDFYRRVNFDLFIFDYRGYGKSTGTIDSEAELHADVRAAWARIAPLYRDKPIVIYGRSLGTGLAAELARDVQPQLLVLVSPYTSLPAVGKLHYPWAPDWLLRYRLDTGAAIAAIHSPILLLHGARDTLIPATESRQLRERAQSPTELVIVDGAGHSDIHRFPDYLDALAARLARVASAPPGNTARRVPR